MEKLRAHKKGEAVELDITDVNNLGCGVGRLTDGKVVFVKGAVTGDRISAEIINDNKSYAVARLCRVTVASPYRFDGDFCSAPLSCGGCVYRHVTYEHEKQIKYNFVRSAFDKAGLSDVAVLPVISTNKVTGYRNKGQYPVCRTKDGMKTGFYASKTHKIVPAEGCAIQAPVFTEITAAVCELCDRYGEPPKPAYTLCRIALLRGLGIKAEFEKIEEREKEIVFSGKNPHLSAVQAMANKNPGAVRMLPGATPAIVIRKPKGRQTVDFICDLLTDYIQICSSIV